MRSTTLTLSRASSARRVPGQSSSSKMTSSAPAAWSRPWSSSTFPLPIQNCGSGFERLWTSRRRARRPRSRRAPRARRGRPSCDAGADPDEDGASRARPSATSRRSATRGCGRGTGRRPGVRHQLIDEPASRSRSLRRILSSVARSVADDQAAGQPVLPRGEGPRPGPGDDDRAVGDAPTMLDRLRTARVDHRCVAGEHDARPENRTAPDVHAFDDDARGSR